MQKLGRRSFLGLCGGSLLLSHWLRSAIGRAQGAEAPRRLVLLHRPNGSIAEDWLVGGQPGPILEPLSPVWSHAVALKGVNVRPSGSEGGSHEAGLLTIMTGARVGETYRTSDDFRSTAESLEQTLLSQSAELSDVPVKSLQVAAHGEQDGGNETPNITMSYSGPDTPLFPVVRPSEVYTRLFSELMPGGATDENMNELQALRARRRSVLDFVRADLSRARSQFPSSFKDDLDIHAEAIREMEQSLDTFVPSGDCTPPTNTVFEDINGDYENMAQVGAAHLAIITAALSCDVTRVVTFMWATGASKVGFRQFGSNNHHSTSHDDDREVLSAIERWFSEATLPFVQSLVDTPDASGGHLIDSTLVWYLNEVSEGWSHSFEDYPFVLFGGDKVGLLDRGRVLDVSGAGHTSNDVWSSFAPVFGGSLPSFETEYTGPIPGLFST